MARRKLLSNDLEKIIKKVDDLLDHYDIKEVKEFKQVRKLLADWKISCIVEEELTPKGEKVVYYVEEPDIFEEFVNF